MILANTVAKADPGRDSKTLVGNVYIFILGLYQVTNPAYRPYCLISWSRVRECDMHFADCSMDCAAGCNTTGAGKCDKCNTGFETSATGSCSRKCITVSNSY